MLKIVYAGLWTHPSPKSYEGKDFLILHGHSEAHHGLTIGVPVTLEEDATSPLRLATMGRWDRTVAKGMRACAKQNEVSVVISGDKEDIVAVARAGLWTKPVAVRVTGPVTP